MDCGYEGSSTTCGTSLHAGLAPGTLAAVVVPDARSSVTQVSVHALSTGRCTMGSVQTPAADEIEWTDAWDTAFLELKRRLTSFPVLKSPDFSKSFILQTDASDCGIRAVLSQISANGEENPVSYYSRKLLPREERYATLEKESLAIKLSIHAFCLYLLGRHFTVQTDHRALEWMHRMKDGNPRLARWNLALQPFNFIFEHRPGRDNGNADGLSRGVVSATE